MLNHRLGWLAKIASGALLAALLLIVTGLATPAQATGTAPGTHIVALHEMTTHAQTGTSPILLARCAVPLNVTISFTGLSSHIGGDWLEPITPGCSTVIAPLHTSANPSHGNWLLPTGAIR